MIKLYLTSSNSLIIFFELFDILWRLLLSVGSIFLERIRVGDHLEVEMLGVHILHEVDAHEAESLLFIRVV